MELVRRADPAVLERLRVRVDAVGKHAVEAARELCLPPVHDEGLRYLRWRGSSSRTGTRPSGGVRWPCPSARSSATACTGSTSSRREGHTAGHNLERAAPPAWARAAGDAAKRRARAGGRLRRRLRDRARLASHGEPGGRRPLDRRHGRHPAHALADGRATAAAARVHGDRLAGAPRAVPHGATATPVRAGARVGGRRRSRTAIARRRSFVRIWRPRRGDGRGVRSVRRGRAGVPARQTRHPPSTS